jgi:hypothetical protein
MLVAEFERFKPTELLPVSNQELAQKLKELATTYKRKGAIYREAMEELGYPDVEDVVAENACTYPDCKCIVTTSTSQPVPLCPLGREPKKVKAPKAKAIPKPPKVVVPGTGEEKGQHEGSGAMIRRLWMTGKYTPDQLVEIVHKNFPGRTTKKSDVYWNYKKLLELNTPDVPAWPEKPKAALKAIVIKGKPDPVPEPAAQEEKTPEPYDVKAMANATDLGRKQSRGKAPKKGKKDAKKA